METYIKAIEDISKEVAVLVKSENIHLDIDKFVNKHCVRFGSREIFTKDILSIVSEMIQCDDYSMQRLEYIYKHDFIEDACKIGFYISNEYCSDSNDHIVYDVIMILIGADRLYYDVQTICKKCKCLILCFFLHQNRSFEYTTGFVLSEFTPKELGDIDPTMVEVLQRKYYETKDAQYINLLKFIFHAKTTRGLVMKQKFNNVTIKSSYELRHNNMEDIYYDSSYIKTGMLRYNDDDVNASVINSGLIDKQHVISWISYDEIVDVIAVDDAYYQVGKFMIGKPGVLEDIYLHQRKNFLRREIDVNKLYNNIANDYNDDIWEISLAKTAIIAILKYIHRHQPSVISRYNDSS